MLQIRTDLKTNRNLEASVNITDNLKSEHRLLKQKFTPLGRKFHSVKIRIAVNIQRGLLVMCHKHSPTAITVFQTSQGK